MLFGREPFPVEQVGEARVKLALLEVPKAGIYPFVSHSFASVMLGEVGLLDVGNVAGTTSH